MEKKSKSAELEATAILFLREIRDHIEAGDNDTAQALIKGASMGLAMAEDADGELREAFGMKLAILVGQTLISDDTQPDTIEEG